MSESAVYTLNIGAKGTEEKRLTDQHGDFLALTESLIPLSIRSHLESLGHAPAIADVGTGTGIWLLDLAKEVPNTARLDGFDVDQSKFSTELPPNVNLGLANILEPFPEQLHGQYDLVHVRLLMFALKADQWVAAANNLLTILKPGGYLMWDETGFTSWSCVPTTESFQKWITTDIRYAQLAGRDPTSPMRLEHQLREAGYMDTSYQDFSSWSRPEETAELFTRGLIAIGRQSLHGIVARGGFEWVQSHEEVDRHFDDMEAECNKGICTMGASFRWTIGRKPET